MLENHGCVGQGLPQQAASWATAASGRASQESVPALRRGPWGCLSQRWCPGWPSPRPSGPAPGCQACVLALTPGDLSFLWMQRFQLAFLEAWHIFVKYLISVDM